MGNHWLRTYMVCSYTYTSLLSSESTCLQIICTHCVILSTCCIPTSNCIYHLSCRHMAETCHTLGQHMHVTHAQPLFSWPPRAARRSAHVILVHKKLGPFFACHLLTYTKAEPLSVLFSIFFRRFSVLFCSRDDFNSEEGAVCTAERAAHSHIVTNGAVGEADRCAVSTWRRDLISSSSRL